MPRAYVKRLVVNTVIEPLRQDWSATLASAPKGVGAIHRRSSLWIKATKDTAAVRIAMTIAKAGKREGALLTVTHEAGLDTDAPETGFEIAIGVINADLTVGADVTLADALMANEGLCSPGVKLHGAGFIVTKA